MVDPLVPLDAVLDPLDEPPEPLVLDPVEASPEPLLPEPLPDAEPLDDPARLELPAEERESVR